MPRGFTHIAFCGPSAAGKSVLADWLVKDIFPVFGISTGRVVSTTTRLKKDSDPEGEYKYITRFYFEQLKQRRVFAWVTPEYAGNFYATAVADLEDSVKTSFREDKIFMLILLPQTIPIAKDHIESMGGELLSFYIDCSDERELRRRISERDGDSPDLEARIRESRNFATIARRYETVYWINNSNNDGLVSAKEQILAILKKEGITPF